MFRFNFIRLLAIFQKYSSTSDRKDHNIDVNDYYLRNPGQIFISY